MAYLLFRIADTLEDADLLPRDPRVEGLGKFEALLASEHPASAQLQKFVTWCAAHPTTANADCARLLEHTPYVFVGLEGCDDRAAAVIRRHLRGTTQRMAAFVRRADSAGSLALTGLADLRDYCYAVAGIVGEMLCELVILDQPRLVDAKADLERDAVAFGEALQLVNILRDAGADAKAGRTWVPKTVDRDAVFKIATDDLSRARRYIRTLHAHGAHRGTLAFHALPVRLAERTLAIVHRDGPGAKLPRSEVLEQITATNASLDRSSTGLD